MTTEIEAVTDAVTDAVVYGCGYSLREHAVQAVILTVVAGGLGGLLGYKLSEKKLQTKFDKLLDEEVDKVRSYYKQRLEPTEEPEVVDEPQRIIVQKADLAEARRAIQQYRGDVLDPEDEADYSPQQAHGVDVSMEFEAADEGWDWEEQLAFRESLDEGEPFIVHVEEYMLNEDGYDQITLTFYSGDGVLADDQDKDIPYPDPIVGEDNLSRFGFGSGNEHTLFIRNDRLSSLFEITVVEGKYAHEVLGITHSDDARSRQRRKELRRVRSDPE